MSVADGPMSWRLSGMSADTAQSLVIGVPRAGEVEASGASESGETSKRLRVTGGSITAAAGTGDDSEADSEGTRFRLERITFGRTTGGGVDGVGEESGETG